VGSGWTTTTYTLATDPGWSTTRRATAPHLEAVRIGDPTQGSFSKIEHRFDNLKVAINGTGNLLTGPEFTYGNSGSRHFHTGEIRNHQ
jgi:hypothetical protein